MYFLTKFCRICIQSDVKLIDLDTLDFDEVKLSEKLEVCTKMVIARECFSYQICMQCITKLRISYQFYDMCTRSSITLQKYLNRLVCEKESNVSPENFINTELNVLVPPLVGYQHETNDCNIETETISKDLNFHREKRKRITKEQRCSLLKRLLMPSERDRCEIDALQYYKVQTADNFKGLKNIISFTENYEFGCRLDKNSNYDSSPLDKLKAFSNEFFKRDFSEFKNTILFIIENNENISDIAESDEDGFDTPYEKDDSDDHILQFEEVIVEPDFKIKTEIEFDEDTDLFAYSEYSQSADVKTINGAEVKSEFSESTLDIYCSDYSKNLAPASDSMHFLHNFVGTYPHRRTFSPSNVRCRTRDNPYINPKLREQFLHRSFRCEKCSRYFKSPGYLKAHCSKVHSSVVNFH